MSATNNKPEALRVRDLNRYYQPYKNAQAQHDKTALNVVDSFSTDPAIWSATISAHKPQFSADKTLTAFAQLASLRLNVRRCLISLIDDKYQYVLTEATPTLSLSRHTIDRDDDRVWLGKSVFNREDAMCTHMFGSTYTAVDEDGTSYKGDGLVVTDCTKDDRFKNKPFVIGEPFVCFYAAVPIKTKSGYTIGTYALDSNKPRPNGLSVAEFRFMEDVASSVMEHLEMIRDREDRSKGERMVRGLSEFIEGSCALGKSNLQSATSPYKTAQMLQTTKLKSTSETIDEIPETNATSVLQRQTENLRSMAYEDGESPMEDGIFDMAPLERKISQTTGRRIIEPPPSNPNCIFYRAASIIRKSTLADGAVFFRASGPNLRTRSPTAPEAESSMDESQSQTSGSEVPNPRGALQREALNARSPSFTTQKAQPKTVDPQDTKVCEVLGLSVEEDVLEKGNLDLADLKFLEKDMNRYITKFPYGKFFSFTETGSGLSSGETESEVEQTLSVPPITNGHKNHTNGINKAGVKGKRQKFIPTELLKILPGVRTLIFLPLWDGASERWLAGGFIWTSHAGALLSPDNELPFLKAFANSITSEYARMNALISDRAKTDFISSISHETRSPLHGILGSVEFLSETELTPFQTGLVASVETCAKTLLDTLEHILDYAKINKLGRRRLDTRVKKRDVRDSESSIMGPTSDIDLHQLVEEVVESVCAGHAFRETHAGAGLSEKSEKTSNLSHLAVSVEISPRLKNLVCTQPGAIRRIVMNLLGNSLKYTQEGYVAVKMRGQPVNGDSSRLQVVMTFIDSGRGMSIEYQKTRMFSPFSQEDPFADGTGLGLSIVRQIVDSLGGHIDIKSTKGVGTTVEVHLTLVAAGEQHDQFADVKILTSGKRMLLVDGDKCSKSLQLCKQAFNVNIREWFGLEMGMTSSNVKDESAHGFICHESSPDFCQLAVGATPLMVVCNNQSNQIALRRRLLNILPPCSRSNVHIVAQPLGPHKLAQVFQRMFADRPLSSHPTTSGEELLHAVGMSSRDTKSSIDPSEPLYRPVLPVKTHLSETIQPKKVEYERLDRAQTEPAQQKEEATQRPVPARMKSGLSHEIPLSQHNVLLVDDNSINLQLLVMFMRKIKVQHSKAENGLEALESYKANSNGSSGFTYVLMDINMPLMNGLESTRRIRQFERECGAPKAIIIALTGLGSQDAQKEARDAGVDFYLAKPVKFAELKRLMNM